MLFQLMTFITARKKIVSSLFFKRAIKIEATFLKKRTLVKILAWVMFKIWMVVLSLGLMRNDKGAGMNAELSSS